MQTSVVAWYAAILSTIVLVWDLAKWWRAEPRLRVTARANVGYPDSEVVRETELPDGVRVGEMASYCHVEIVNVGGRPTTLTRVEVFSRNKNKVRGEVFLSTSNFTVHKGSDPLPAKLAPGEMWSARLDMRQLESLRQFGAIHISARATYRNRPITSRMLEKK